MLDRMKFLQIEKLCFQQAEEVLGTGISPFGTYSAGCLSLSAFSDSACVDTASLGLNEESDLCCPVFLKMLSQAYPLPDSNSDDGLDCMKSLRHYIDQ